MCVCRQQCVVSAVQAHMGWLVGGIQTSKRAPGGDKHHAWLTLTHTETPAQQSRPANLVTTIKAQPSNTKVDSLQPLEHDRGAA